MKRLAVATAGVLGLACAVLATAHAAEDAVEPSPLEIVQGAFDRMFNYPSVRSITLGIYRHGSRITYRSFDVVYKKIAGRGHTLLRFTEPEYLRDNALLTIEEEDARSDTWIYQRELRRPRRVLVSHKRDSFYGSDLTFEDLEHHDWPRYQLRRLPDTTEQGRPAYVVEGTAPADSQYSKAIVTVERDRLALLRVDLFGPGAGAPIKSLEVAPGEIVQGASRNLRPARMWVRQRGREATTEVVFDRIEEDPAIADHVFATMRLLQSGEDLYKVVERLREEPSDP